MVEQLRVGRTHHDREVDGGTGVHAGECADAATGRYTFAEICGQRLVPAEPVDNETMLNLTKVRE